MTRRPDNSSPGSEALAAGLRGFPVVGIVRGCPPDHLQSVVRGAVDGGLRVVEVTMDSPEPLRGIASLASALPDLVVGAGTVRSPGDALAAIDAGAAFVVSPDINDDTVEACRSAGVPALPGAATPTEIARALRLGAFAVKVFPAAQLGGPAFVAAVMGPLGRPPLVPTGGVDAASAPSYLDAGAIAVGVGGSIFRRDLMDAGDAAGVEQLTSRLASSMT